MLTAILSCKTPNCYRYGRLISDFGTVPIAHSCANMHSTLTKEEAEKLINTPVYRWQREEISALKAVRDQAILAVMIGTGLRRNATYRRFCREKAWPCICITASEADGRCVRSKNGTAVPGCTIQGSGGVVSKIK